MGIQMRPTQTHESTRESRVASARPGALTRRRKALLLRLGLEALEVTVAAGSKTDLTRQLRFAIAVLVDPFL